MESGLVGEYRSVVRGRGVEFDEVRPYADGDDVRSIDWNVTARTGEPFVKKHVEEREQTVVFAVDVSASVLYGTRSNRKRDLEAEVCCVLGVTAAANGDRTGLLIFSDRIERFVPPARGSRHALAIARSLLSHESEGRGTDIGAALEMLNRVLRRRAVVFLVSDFLGTGFERPLATTARRHDVVALTVLDRRETEVPSVGVARLEDAETGERVVADLSDDRVRAAIRERIDDATRTRERLFARIGVDSATLYTNEPYDTGLHRLFARRAARLG